MSDGIGLVIFTALLLLALVAGHAYGPVTRGQVSRFARQQRLKITVGNGEQVIRYLAHTRRWRIAGLSAGVAFNLVLNFLRQPDSAFDFTALFAGWFVGALIAEVRLATGPAGPRRVASLQPRTFRQYVGVATWMLVPAAMLGSVVVFGTVIRHGDVAWQTLCLVAALATTIATLVVRARVVERAQTQLASDMLAADNAIRSRSLHVLCGGGAALVLLCVASQLAHGGHWILGPLVTFGAAVLGWNVGTARVRAVKRARPAAAVAS